MHFTVGIISRNLATTSNFVEFRDSRKFQVFQGNGGSAGQLAHFERLERCHVSGAELVKQREPSGAHMIEWKSEAGG